MMPGETAAVFAMLLIVCWALIAWAIEEERDDDE